MSTCCPKTFVVLILILTILLQQGSCFRCDRRPYGANTLPSESDGRYQLEVIDSEGSYIPDQLYTVQITRTNEESWFTSFMISVEGDTMQDPQNPRHIMNLSPGDLRPKNSMTAKFSERCLYSVEQFTTAPKTSVEVYWQAPSSNSGCVTLRAMVAENDVSWFLDGPPLTLKICEDTRQPDDVAPLIIENCGACDEAKYEISFTGIWSRNTHPRQYPENDWIPRYSDLIGASHSVEHILWAPGSLATDGLKDLAEYANSTALEAEIRSKIGNGVRTLIKGKGHGYRKMNTPTYAYLRTDSVNHLFTAMIGLYPSPDWFLGVSRFELCQANGTWLQERELNLYPWDAGTDSGVSYESPNIVTFPQGAVGRVEISSHDKNSPFFEMDMKHIHPFGKLQIKLMRTYARECEEATEASEDPEPERNAESSPNEAEPDEPSRYQNPEIENNGYRRTEAPVLDPESSPDCPMSPWGAWSDCDGVCEDGKLVGRKWRARYHLVDGIAVEKYGSDIKSWSRKEVPKYCKSNYEVFDEEACEEDCVISEDGIIARRRMYTPIAPGHGWGTNKRDLKENSPNFTSVKKLTA